jgi:hypothetical protein
MDCCSVDQAVPVGDESVDRQLTASKLLEPPLGDGVKKFACRERTVNALVAHRHRLVNRGSVYVLFEVESRAGRSLEPGRVQAWLSLFGRRHLDPTQRKVIMTDRRSCLCRL